MYICNLFWSVFLAAVFFKACVYEDFSLMVDGKTRLHLAEIYLLEVLMRARVSVYVLT